MQYKRNYELHSIQCISRKYDCFVLLYFISQILESRAHSGPQLQDGSLSGSWSQGLNSSFVPLFTERPVGRFYLYIFVFLLYICICPLYLYLYIVELHCGRASGSGQVLSVLCIKIIHPWTFAGDTFRI